MEQIQGDLAKICTRKQVLLLKTLSKQLNAIPMGLSRTEIQHMDIVQNIEHLRKQAILLKIHSRQLNAIPMGFSRQKFCIENIIQNITQNLEHLPGSK